MKTVPSRTDIYAERPVKPESVPREIRDKENRNKKSLPEAPNPPSEEKKKKE